MFDLLILIYCFVSSGVEFLPSFTYAFSWLGGFYWLCSMLFGVVSALLFIIVGWSAFFEKDKPFVGHVVEILGATFKATINACVLYLICYALSSVTVIDNRAYFLLFIFGIVKTSAHKGSESKSKDA